jgi:choline dehydrogenase-like flavoprotein
MFHDARQLEGGAEIRADVCIVGAGAAGIAIARELIGGRERVALLTSGGFEFARGPQKLYAGDNVGRVGYTPYRSRVRMYGGSTTRWAGHCRPLERLDFERRDWVPHSGWPFSRNQLEPYYRRAQEVCRLGPYDYEPSTWSANGRQPLTVDPHTLDVRIYQFGHPTDFGKIYKGELEAARNVDVWLHADVLEIEVDGDVRRVTGLRVATSHGRYARFVADRYVLACGGLENPRLLLLSNRVEPRGLGNRHDQVGRCFQEHPVVEVAQVFGFAESLARVAGPIAGSPVLLPDLCPSAELVTRERLQQFGIELGPAGEPVWDLDRRQRDGTRRFVADAARLLPWLTNEIDESGSRRPGGLPAMKRARLDSMQEMAPDPACRVTLGEERDALGCRRLVLDLRLGAEFRRTLAAAARALVHELGRFSIGRVAPSAWTAPGFDGEIPWRGAAHHLGTTRMSDDPARGVVDRDCRVHGVDNLWIAGSSVFPASGYVNPTLTIVALALRLAEHLEARLP